MTTLYPSPKNAPPRGTVESLWIRHERYIGSLIRDGERKVPPGERAELGSAVREQIVRRFASLRMDGARNPDALETTWIRWQVLAAIKRVNREFNRHVRDRAGDDLPIGAHVDEDAWGGDVAHDLDGDASRASARLAVARVWAEASPAERTLMASVLRGEDEPGILRTRYDVTPGVRRTRLAALGRRLLEDHDGHEEDATNT